MKVENTHRLAIISDVHIGDPRCTLFSIMDEKTVPEKEGIYFNSETQMFYKYPHDKLIIKRHNSDSFYKVKIDMSKKSQYMALVKIAKEVDSFIILGDLFDIAMQRNDIAYELVKTFLDQLQQDAGKKEFIYVPGNHDYSLWRYLQWESDVIKQVDESHMARVVRHVVPGVLSFKDNKKQLKLFKYIDTQISMQYPEDNSQYVLIDKKDYERTHINNIFGSYITLVYPNLYIMDDQDRVTLLTHGQYFEDNWSKISNSMSKNLDGFVSMLAKQFNLTSKELSKKDIVNKIEDLKIQVDNFNLPQFIQANSLVGNIQSEVGYETGVPAQLDILLRNYYEEIKDIKPVKVKPSTDYLTVSKIIKDADGSKPKNDSNVEWYIYRTMQELMKISKNKQVKIEKFIYGHTHVPGIANTTKSSQPSSFSMFLEGSYVSGSTSASHLSEYINAYPVKFQIPVSNPEIYTVINTGGWLRNHPHDLKEHKFHGYGKPCGAVVPILHNGEVKEIKVLA